ncbi:MAG: xanthine dehydrogenase family protein molybdopterin-binding subunit [Caldilineales bacterium]|nr:xanthine dehydrogenase family protein molybdopterin-binding subunit [Caldilineales bacterium]MDW8316333.1 xanthine dehydrogenase family protein molybdopterin-binding subunit [Anaerolineae bacterium]
MDARDKVTGAAIYPGDIERPNTLWMKILFAERPHARIRRIDTRAAEAAPGVVAVFTAADVPFNGYGLNHVDQPVLCGPGAPDGVPDADRVRWIGDQVALVIAETEAQAAAALPLIQIEWEDLPLVESVEEAMQPGAFLLHPSNGSNVLLEYHIRRGDIEEGFSLADVIVESTYRSGAQEHAYLQPEAGVSYVDSLGRVVVEVAGQWVHKDRQQIATALRLPEEQIVVRYPAIGGAFGGREDMSIQIVLALAAWRLHQRGIDRPVKIIWSRRESIIGHHKRHPMVARARWGATRDGKLVAQWVDFTLDAGAYAYTSTKVLGNATLASLGPYECPHQWVDARTVYTNHVPSGAFRGFGGPQGHFIAETQMNKLAEALGMDPIELRLRNCWREGSLQATRSPVPAGVSIEPVLRRLREELNAARAADRSASSAQRSPMRTSLDISTDRRLRGWGVGCCFKNVGFSLGFRDVCHATVELHGAGEIERAVVRHAGAEVGQGAHTAMAQFAAELLNLPLERVELVVQDTAETANSGSSSASRMTFMAGNAIKGAVQMALAKWEDEERPAIAHYEYVPRATTPYDPETGASDPNITYGYCAQAAEVEVDPDTGHVHVVRIISVNDVGKAINPQQVEGQIEGGVSQSVGWTVLENFVEQGGRVLTDQLSTYLIPTVADVAEVKPVIVEIPDPHGPLGARGMAEMPFVPTAPAIVAAVREATGIWFDQIPLTPERVWRGLRAVSGGR